MTHITDDFEDGVINPDVWVIGYKSGGGSCVEEGGFLKVECPSDGDSAGIVTRFPYDLEDGYVKVYVEHGGLNIIGIFISPNLSTATHPMFVSNSYGLILGSKGTSVRFYRNSEQKAVVGLPAEGVQSLTLKISLEGSKIVAYYDGTKLYEEEYAFDTKEVYVYLHGSGSSDEVGTGIFDNFELYSPPPPPTPSEIIAQTVNSMVNSLIQIFVAFIAVSILKSVIKKFKK